ncbi:MAG: SDR family oxidoreductase [Melioribacteraceae bacterium]|nr:SDR family oxidoreductase [Melioribacteraceae bacterium]MCF8263289.1 SDR family oxidoreductase [Melioribacteraceae bacterium]MCF8413980.1 SDR family oxidoreductase [Melioribacteraceae bacterium]MCF8431988.1 SDR family oxidoreductase [Melioribacteraceae bacterium]
MELFSLNGKVAIVTGALGLIGKEHCKALSEAGANVVVADLNLEKCEEFALSLKTKSIGVFLDVTRKEILESALNTIIDRFGKIDILINNAAINDMFENPKAAAEQSKFENYPLEIWQKSLDVNLTGVFLCSQVFGKQMADQGSGSIINIASTYGITGPDQSLYIDKNGKQNFFKPPAYSATKGGVIAFTKYLAAYWGKNGVRVNTLSPGGVENNQDEFFIEQYSKRTPLNKMAEVNDYKGAVVFLASDASKYMTGANLIVDGGWTCW